MEFLHTVKRKSALSEVIYYLLNIGLAVALFAISQTIQHPVFAILLIILSKWRVLAVRPRYWWSNLQANMVDIVVGLSVAILMYTPGITIVAQVALAAFYAIWLVVIKPKSKKSAMMWQSLIAIILGTTATLTISYEWPVIFTVAGMMLIGYSAARHFLFTHDEQNIIFLSTIWGVLFAEIGWLAHYWTYAYSLPGMTALKIPQATIILVLVSFLGERVYKSWKNNGSVQFSDIALPVVFATALIFVILIFLNSVTI